MLPSSHERHALAIHEAAHAVVGDALGLELLAINVDFVRWSGGATFQQGFAPEGWRRDVVVSLAGEEAQRRVDPSEETLFDERGELRAAHDWSKVDRAVGRYNHHPDSEEEDRISEARICAGKIATRQLLDVLWPAIEKVAAAIEAADGAVSASDFYRVINDAISPQSRTVAVERLDFIHKPFNAP